VALSLLISAWLVGLMGGIHCLAMCGGFLTAAIARDAAVPAAVPLLSAAAIARRELGYHAGRLATYALLGGAFGAAGTAALDVASLLPLQRVLYVVANLLLLAVGISVATGAPGIASLQRGGAKLFGALLPVLQPLLRRPGAAGRVAMGLAWGLVPCALVYSVLPLALFAGGTWQGAAVMLAFGAGTVPNLATAGFVLRRSERTFAKRGWRYAAAAVVVAFAATGIYRSLFVSGALAQGAFCLID
jgi:uncharacterized protein